MHLMKYTEWESPSGWHSGDVSDLANMSNAWWYPARLLNMTPANYILFLRDQYNAYDFSYCEKTNLLLWRWDQKNCHAFTLMINKKAREKKFMI